MDSIASALLLPCPCLVPTPLLPLPLPLPLPSFPRTFSTLNVLEEHALHTNAPHNRQWCRLRNKVNSSLHNKHWLEAWSGVHACGAVESMMAEEVEMEGASTVPRVAALTPLATNKLAMSPTAELPGLSLRNDMELMLALNARNGDSLLG